MIQILHYFVGFMWTFPWAFCNISPFGLKRGTLFAFSNTTNDKTHVNTHFWSLFPKKKAFVHIPTGPFWPHRPKPPVMPFMPAVLYKKAAVAPPPEAMLAWVRQVSEPTLPCRGVGATFTTVVKKRCTVPQRRFCSGLKKCSHSFVVGCI